MQQLVNGDAQSTNFCKSRCRSDLEIAIMKTCANACCAAMAGAASSADPGEALKSIINSFAAIQEKTWQKISLPYARAATRPYIASFLPNGAA